MQTKLRRIEELMKVGQNYSDADFSKLQSEFDSQFTEIKDENTMLKERVRKLHIIQTGLSSKIGNTQQHKVSKTFYGSTSKKGKQFGGKQETKVVPYVSFTIIKI